ncbi:hypothetical protein GDO86_017661 [Hymenochirus boettgeri]|uniref:Uncharacterized protein n=1 Tax=Hymenochirus boettgeri TaxID=247094 RepID=A0A8T2INB3_9PIPI|nr:hypothetical protein GDO86_017661 [Hymenochirus boettgeri]
MKTIVLLAVLVNILFSHLGSGNVLRGESSALTCRTCIGYECINKHYTIATCATSEDTCMRLVDPKSPKGNRIVYYVTCQTKSNCLMYKEHGSPVVCCKDIDCKEYHQ